MADTFFSLIVFASQTREVYFRDLMESLVAQSYENWELYVLDEGGSHQILRITQEFFPEDARMHYRKLKTQKGGAYAHNIGFHFVLVDALRSGREGYLVLVNQHDRLQPNALEVLAQNAGADILYTDHDELIGANRMHPHFKPELSVELLRHYNYIGPFFAISYHRARVLGEFNEKLSFAWAYDYLLRATEAQMSFRRIPGLLYHKRIFENEPRLENGYDTEARTVVQAHLVRAGVDAEVTSKRRQEGWEIVYHGADAYAKEREYLFLKEKGVHIFGRHGIERMYGILKQKDVAVVGVRTIKSGLRVDSNGFLFDESGMTYPAFHGASIYQPSYENYGHLPREVSSVESAICMIDAKVYRKLGGFDKSLTGRDLMLDFCLRARKKGMRTVVDPRIVARIPSTPNESNESSRMALLERHEAALKESDPYYNPNLYLGMHNFSLEENGESEEE